MAQGTDDQNSPYARRIARAMSRGLTRSQARGHPKTGEAFASGLTVLADARLTQALNQIRAGKSLTVAASAAAVSRERVRQALAEHGDYVRQGSRFRFIARQRNDLPLYSAGDSIRVTLDDENASRLGAYMSAVGKFLATQRLPLLDAFIGDGVTDVQGRFHPFETDAEELYRLDTKGHAVFHQIYQSTAGGAQP